MKRREHLAALLVFVSTSLTSLTAFGQESSKADKIRQIEKVLKTHYEYGQFQGAALVALRGEVIYRKGFGPANVEWGIPNTPETRYSIASHGKAFTAVLILQLVEKGRLDLHVPIAKYLPAYRKDNAEQVTIHHLLGHSSGVLGVPREWSETQNRNPYTLARLVELANLGELEFEPGTRFAYSNNGYNLLAAIIEKVTGKTYEQVLQERILDPLGMTDTGLVKHQPIVARRASNYNRLFWGELVNAPYMDESFAVGAGGMYSTVDDMFKWDQALRSDKLLSPASRKLMFTPGLGDAGYGWGVGTYTSGGDGDENTLVYGFGGTNGAASVTYRLIEDNHLIVLLGNIRQVPQARIASNLTNILVDVPLNPIAPPRDAELYRRIRDDGIDAAVRAYGRMKDDPAVRGLPNENRINEMGYELLQYGRVSDAIEVFRFNVAAHPQYANGFDSLGEAYEKNDQLPRARDSFAKALRLGREADDPNVPLYKANRDRVARRLPQRPRSGGRGKSRRAARVLRVLDVSAGQAVADIGFGKGWLSEAVADVVGADGKVYAVEIREDLVKRMRERGLPNVTAILSEADDVKLPADSVDVAVMHDVASHVDKKGRPEFYASIARALKPNGRLVIFGPHGRAAKMLDELRDYGFIPEDEEELRGLTNKDLDARLEAGIRFQYR